MPVKTRRMTDFYVVERFHDARVSHHSGLLIITYLLQPSYCVWTVASCDLTAARYISKCTPSASRTNKTGYARTSQQGFWTASITTSVVACVPDRCPGPGDLPLPLHTSTTARPGPGEPRVDRAGSGLQAAPADTWHACVRADLLSWTPCKKIALHLSSVGREG
jgi:hypothetical protein